MSIVRLKSFRCEYAMLNDTKIKSLRSKEKMYRIADGGGLVIEVKPTTGKKNLALPLPYKWFGNNVNAGGLPLCFIS